MENEKKTTFLIFIQKRTIFKVCFYIDLLLFHIIKISLCKVTSKYQIEGKIKTVSNTTLHILTFLKTPSTFMQSNQEKCRPFSSQEEANTSFKHSNKLSLCTYISTQSLTIHKRFNTFLTIQKRTLP